MKIKFITIKNKFKKFYLNSPNSLIEFMNQEGSAKWQRFMIGRSKSDMDIFRIKMRSFIMILLILLGMNKCRAIELSHVKLDGKVNYNFSELEQGENILKKPDFFIINKKKKITFYNLKLTK